MRPTIDQMLNSQWILITKDFENPKIKITKKKFCSSSKRKNPENNLKNFVPIQCSTKRTNSVLVENFLMPIEISTENPIEKETIKTRRSIFSSNMKKKIGPMETVINQSCNRSIDISNNSKKSSICSANSKIVGFDEEQGDFIMLPTLNETSLFLNPLEIEAKRILLNLGITTEMLESSIQYGPRCDIIGKINLFQVSITFFDLIFF